MIVLRKYQRTKVNELRQHTTRLLEDFADVPNKTIVFQSPTGSGKTIIMAHYIREYLQNEAAEASVIITTQKDLVKITERELAGRPLWAVEIAVEIVSGSEQLDRALGTLPDSRRFGSGNL